MGQENGNERIAMKVSRVSIAVNLILAALKLAAGLAASSGAMVSDAVHSASDVFSTFVVMIGIRMSGKSSDKKHPYGHERLECVAAVILAAVLAVTGMGIGFRGAVKLTGNGVRELEEPGQLALWAAAASILTKEWMYQYTRQAAKRIGSGALMADAWHHRSDALSSVGAFAGIAGARMGYLFFDPLAEVIICLFILKAAWEVFRDAVEKMIDQSCDELTETRIKNLVRKQEGVIGIDCLHTRMFGSRIYVDVEISCDGDRTLRETHRIAEQVQEEIEKNFCEVKHIMVHVNPADEEGR